MFNSAPFKSRCEFTIIFKSRPIASKSRHSYDIPHALHVHVADFQGNFWNGEAANAAANFILFRNGQHRTQCKALDGHTVRNYCCLNALHTALAWLVCVFAHISFSITPLYNIQLVFSMHHPSSFPPPPCRPSWSSWTWPWQHHDFFEIMHQQHDDKRCWSEFYIGTDSVGPLPRSESFLENPPHVHARHMEYQAYGGICFQWVGTWKWLWIHSGTWTVLN